MRCDGQFDGISLLRPRGGRFAPQLEAEPDRFDAPAVFQKFTQVGGALVVGGRNNGGDSCAFGAIGYSDGSFGVGRPIFAIASWPAIGITGK